MLYLVFCYLLCVCFAHEIKLDQKNYCPSPVIIESIPYDLYWPPLKGLNSSMSTYNGLRTLVQQAKETLLIAGMYISLSEGTAFPSSVEILGYFLFQDILEAYARKVKISIVVNIPLSPEWITDIEKLRKYGINVLEVDWSKYTGGLSYMHTKLLIADNSSVYMGSANFDWRSLTEVKELGIIFNNCIPIVNDLKKIFDFYWLCATNSNCPSVVPLDLSTPYNASNPLKINFVDSLGNEEEVPLYFASSPLKSNAQYRSNDADAIIGMISNSNKFIYATVMDYSPISTFNKPPIYWGELDNSLRSAALRGVQVKLLVSLWNHTAMNTIVYLQSLDIIPNIQVSVVQLPISPIPFTRVCHAKNLITEKGYYITTSNWTPDYFLMFGGVSLTMNSVSQIVEYQRMCAVFESIWNYPNYTTPLRTIFPY